MTVVVGIGGATVRGLRARGGPPLGGAADAQRPPRSSATAAVLEGCSFANGGSQNTVQPASSTRGRRVTLPPSFEPAAASAYTMPPYVLGTDFKAGQTKAKTAIVEYLRAL